MRLDYDLLVVPLILVTSGILLTGLIAVFVFTQNAIVGESVDPCQLILP